MTLAGVFWGNNRKHDESASQIDLKWMIARADRVIRSVLPLIQHSSAGPTELTRAWLDDFLIRQRRIVLSKTQLTKFLIGLVAVNDADLVDDDSILSPEICAADDRVVIRRLRDMTQNLYRDFDYLASPEFAAEASGKSDAYHRMLTKRCSDPERQREHRKNYAVAMSTLLSSSRAYELTSPDGHKILDELRSGFASLANPEPDNAAELTDEREPE